MSGIVRMCLTGLLGVLSLAATITFLAVADAMLRLVAGKAEYRLVEHDDGSREWVYTRKDGGE